MTMVVGALLVLLAVVSTAGAGLELDLARLRAGAPWRAAVVRALLANLVVVPAATFVLLRLLPLPTAAATALWLVALAPGGASAPLLARLAGGEPTRVGAVYVALCISSLLAVPLVLPRVSEGAAPGMRLLALCVGLQLLPLAFGLLAGVRHAVAAARYAALLRRFGSVLLGLIVLLLLITRGAFLSTLGVATLVGMVALVLLSIGAGALFAPAPRLPDALLACVRNLTLALLVAEANSPGGMATLIIAAYGLVMYVSAAVCLRLFMVKLPISQGVM
jgi:predicted Na+-dependent transporter